MPKKVRVVFHIAAPSRPESELQSVPPRLRKLFRESMSSCSEGSRGLSVLSWVKGIFTPSATSLSPCPRQWGSRYAIRAGRNLPDKEFRSFLLPLEVMLSLERVGHFCRLPRVATRNGLYLHPASLPEFGV